MSGRLVIAALLVAAAVVGGAPLPANAAPSDDDRALVAAVAERVFAEASASPELAWPPRVAITDSSDIGVFAAVCDVHDGQPPTVAGGGRLAWIDMDSQPAAARGQFQPVVVVTQGLLDNVAIGRPERLAAALAHAVAHILLGHAAEAPRGELLVAGMISPQQETEADILGMKLALAADFPYRSLLACYLAMGDHAAGASFEGPGGGHASWDQRVAQIDARQAELWPSIAAFETGVYFLMAEHYALAEQCFDQVTKECPKSYEAWANLGYARLMIYCDALEADDLRAFDIGPLAVGGFYNRPESLTGMFRGILEPVWYDAVGALRQALILNPNLLLPKASLAVAHLVHPNGKDAARAGALAAQVIAALDAGEQLDPLARAALLVNVGVAAYEGGDTEAAARLFHEAQALVETNLADGTGESLKGSILFHLARVGAAADDDAGRGVALAGFEESLRQGDPTSAWWTLTYDAYAEACREAGVDPRPAADFLEPDSGPAGAIAGISLEDGSIISVGDALAGVEAALRGVGEGELRDLHKEVSIRRLRYESLGLDLLSASRLVAMRLTSSDGPTVVLNLPGGEQRALRPGMTVAELDTALGAAASAWNLHAGPRAGSVFRFYRLLGLAVRIEGDAVAEIIVAEPPIDVAANR